MRGRILGRNWDTSYKSLPQSTYFPRNETGLVCLAAHSAGVFTATLLVMVNVMRGGWRAPPTHTSQGQFYPHQWMYARKQRLQLCVLCGADVALYVSLKEGKEVGCFLHVRRPVQIPDLWRNCGITACQIYSVFFCLQYVLPPHPHTLSTVHTHPIV